MASVGTVWHALNLVTEPSGEEAVAYALMEAGAEGTASAELPSKLVRVTGYFREVPNPEHVHTELARALQIYDLPSSIVSEMTFDEVPDKDWLDEWKKSWQPGRVGRFVIAAPWSEVAPAAGQLVIRIEPGMAFGTGTHETTRLCLAAIEQHFQGGSFLDVGTGTGILAIAAAKLFPVARVEACDIDPEAIAIARENARLNEADRIDFQVGSIETVSVSSAECVCANLTADVIARLLPALIGATCGRLILSGILESQTDLILERVKELGVESEAAVTQDGEWIAIVI